MSRSGYSDDIDTWDLIMWRGAVASALKGARGQAFLKEMLAALDALPEPKLVANALEKDGAVCAMGAVGKSRGISMSHIDPEDPATVSNLFGIARALAQEVSYENDEGTYKRDETEEERFARMREWVVAHLTASPMKPEEGHVAPPASSSSLTGDSHG